MSIPIADGLCRYCRREMWRNREGTRLLAACDRIPGACDTCASWIQRHPGQDPREQRGNVAELVPAERGEAAPAWRHHPDRRCSGAPPYLFEPEPDRDDELPAPAESERVAAARMFCSDCPVRQACRDAALAHGYDGVWGGALFTGPQWRDLITGETGPTIYAQPKRERVPA